MPTSATRLRRDFTTLISLVRAHALLYRAQRDNDDRGRVVPTIDGDYAPVRDLVGGLIAEGVEASASDTLRETVEAVRALQAAKHSAFVTPKELTDSLGIGRSATYDRIKRALSAGYLVDESARNERGMRLTIGAALPSSDDFLPSPDAIRRHMPEWLTDATTSQLSVFRERRPVVLLVRPRRLPSASNRRARRRADVDHVIGLVHLRGQSGRRRDDDRGDEDTRVRACLHAGAEAPAVPWA